MEKIDLNGKTIFITGAAGFIGSNLVKLLFKDVKDATIIGIDNINDYYDVSLKNWRLEQLSVISDKCSVNGIKWELIKGDIADKGRIDKIFEEYKPQIDYPFLNYDSFLCASSVIERSVEVISKGIQEGTTKVIGRLSEQHVSEVLEMVRASKVISKRHKQLYFH